MGVGVGVGVGGGAPPDDNVMPSPNDVMPSTNNVMPSTKAINNMRPLTKAMNNTRPYMTMIGAAIAHIIGVASQLEARGANSRLGVHGLNRRWGQTPHKTAAPHVCVCLSLDATIIQNVKGPNNPNRICYGSKDGPFTLFPDPMQLLFDCSCNVWHHLRFV